MAPSTKPRKSVKKAPAKKTAKKNEIRTVKHGNVTYSSRPQENPGCSPRCTPPYRYVSQATGLKTTTVKYRHRNLAITSPDTVPKKRAAKKTTAKPTARKTVKAPAKTVKTVKKAPVKTTAKKTVKAPTKKAPAKKTAAKTVSCGCAVSPAKPSKPKTVTCGCAQTPAQVKKAILDKAGKEGMNRKDLDKHIIVATVPGIEAKAEPFKAPASWKVPNVGGKFEGKAPVKTPEVTSIPAKDLYEELGIPYRPRKAKKKPVEAAPAKKVPVKKAPAASRGVQGRFDAGALKAVAQFVHKMDRDLDMPIFSNDTQFVDTGRVMALRLVSRMPGRSFVGLPLEQSKRDLAVPMESFIKRLNASVMDVYYQDGRLYYAWKDSPGLSVSTAVHESGNPRRVKFAWSRNANVEGDIRFRTSQTKFASDVKKAIASSGVKLPSRYNTYKDTAMSMCPPKGAVSHDEHIPPQCAGYSAYYLNMIAGLVAKAKGSQCIVMFKPNFPLRVVCDLGPYMAELMLAPIVTPEE